MIHLFIFSLTTSTQLVIIFIILYLKTNKEFNSGYMMSKDKNGRNILVEIFSHLKLMFPLFMIITITNSILYVEKINIVVPLIKLFNMIKQTINGKLFTLIQQGMEQCLL